MITATEWFTLGTAFIGISGTLAGSVVTYFLTSKQESKRWLRAAEEKAEARERENALRFHGEKRIAYSEYIGQMYLWHSQMTSQLNNDYGGQAYGPGGGFDEFEKQVTALRAQLQLMAPYAVVSAAEVCWGAGAAIALTLALPSDYSKEKREKNVSDFTRHLQKCTSVMRDDLEKSGRGILSSATPLPKARHRSSSKESELELSATHAAPPT